MRKFYVAAGAAALIVSAVAGAPAIAEDNPGVKVGVLTCNVEPGWGYVVGSTKSLHCLYTPNDGAAVRYTGDVQKVGLDIGYSEGSTMVWAVVAPASDVGKDALEGKYAGASAKVAVGVGAGLNVLIGGLDKSITLQPVSVEGDTGLNLAAGVTAIQLKYKKK